MPVLSLAIAVCLLVWLALAVKRGPLWAWCLVYLLAVACFGGYFYSLPMGPLPLTADRLLLALAAGVYLVHRRVGLVDCKPLTRADYLLCCFLLLLVASSAWGLATGDASLTFDTLWRLTCGYAMPCTVFWLARQSRLTPGVVRLVHLALASFGGYLVYISLCEMAHLWPLVWPRYIASPEVGLHFGRARGPFAHSVTHGLWLGACLASAWAAWPTCRRPGRIALASLLALLLVSAGGTYTRSVWLGIGAASLTMLWHTLAGRARLTAFVVLVLGGALLGTLNLERILYMKREHSASEAAGSVELRPVFAYVSGKMFLDRPLLGVGFGQFPSAKLPYLDDRTTPLRLQLIRPYVHHNTYLSLLTETGLVGLALFLAIWGSWASRAAALAHSATAPPQVRRHGVVLLAALCVYAFQLMFHDLTYSPADNSILFFLAGLSEGLAATYLPAVAGTARLASLRAACQRLGAWSASPGAAA